MACKDLESIVDLLARTPALVSRIVDGLSEENLRNRSSPDEFSVLEHICHLRDIEHDGYRERISRILNEHQPHLADIDGSRLAIERDYNTQNAARALAEFDVNRRQNIDVLRDVNAKQLAREGTLEGVGVVSLEKLLMMMSEHDADHIGELEIIRRRIDRASD
jgi:DinB family protein